MKKELKITILIISIVAILFVMGLLQVLINIDKKKRMSDVQVTTTETTSQVIDDIPGDSTPQVGDGTPQVGSSTDDVTDTFIIAGDIKININPSVKINGDTFSDNPYKLRDFNNKNFIGMRDKGYKIIKAFRMDGDQGYSEVLIQFIMMSNVSFDNVELFQLKNRGIVKVDKYKGDSKAATYNIKESGVYAFYMKE